jgi:hypothetical protein
VVARHERASLFCARVALDAPARGRSSSSLGVGWCDQRLCDVQMTDGHRLGFAFAFPLGGALGVAALVDLVRYLFDWHSPITTLWLLAIIVVGSAFGVIAFVLLSKTRMRRGPTPNNRWRGP